MTINLINGAGVGLVRQLFPVLFDISHRNCLHALYIHLPLFFSWDLFLEMSSWIYFKRLHQARTYSEEENVECPLLIHWPLIGWLVSISCKTVDIHSVPRKGMFSIEAQMVQVEKMDVVML